MIKTVKTTIRWTDKDGNVLGAVRENDIDLPSWGKAHFLRQEISSVIEALKQDSQKVGKLDCFKAFAMFAFCPERIIKAQCRVVGTQSYVSLKDAQLKQFIENMEVT